MAVEGRFGTIVLSLPCFAFRLLKLPQVDVGHYRKPLGWR
jgi:hypothetical protein